MIGKRLKSKSWWIKCVLFEVNTIIICNVRATNAKRPFYLMKLKTTKRRKWQKKNEVSQEERERKKLSENHFFVANSRFKSIFHRWRALYRTHTHTILCMFPFSLLAVASRVYERATHQRKQSHIENRNIFCWLIFHFIRAHLSSSLSLLITNKKHVSAIYFARNSLPRICHYGIFLFFVLELVV